MSSSTLSPSCLAFYYLYSKGLNFTASALFFNKNDITLLDIMSYHIISRILASILIKY
jgi:hypothetical protein